MKNQASTRVFAPITVLLATVLFVVSCSPSVDQDNNGTGGEETVTTANDIEPVNDANTIPMQVTVAKASISDLAGKLSVSGIAEAYRKATIAAETSGRIIERKVEAGSQATAGDIMLVIDQQRAQLAAMEADAKEKAAEVALASAEAELRRGQDLSRDNFISADQLEQLQFARQSAQANLEAARAAANSASRTFADTSVTAPFNGTVEQVNVHQGDYVTTGTPLLQLADFSRVRVIAGVTASEAALLTASGETTVTFTDLAIDPLPGSIQNIGKVADKKSGTYPVEIWVEQPPGQVIREGMIASITLSYQSSSQTLAIPAAAIFRKQGQMYVYLVNNQAARLTAVRTGRSSAGQVEIISGIEPGDSVIVEGMFALRDGAAVITR